VTLIAAEEGNGDRFHRIRKVEEKSKKSVQKEKQDRDNYKKTK
jgi:hypothetical protein